ncbi:hypothetical protein JCM5350_001597 [Sporobolomyces pararoseus]
MSRQTPIPRPKGIPELEPEDVPADNRRSGRLFKVQLFWRDSTTKRYWCRYPQCPYSNKDSPTLAIEHYKYVHMGKRKIRYKKLCKLCDYLTSPNENLDKGLTEVDFSSYGAPERPGSQPSVVHTPAPRHPLPSNHHTVDSDSISTLTQATNLRPLVSQDQPATGYYDEGWTVPTHLGYNNLESSGLAGSASHLQSNFCTSYLQSNLDTSSNNFADFHPEQATPSFTEQQGLHQSPCHNVLSRPYHPNEFGFVDPSHSLWTSSSPTPHSSHFLPDDVSEYTPISRAGQSSPVVVCSNSSGQTRPRLSIFLPPLISLAMSNPSTNTMRLISSLDYPLLSTFRSSNNEFLLSTNDLDEIWNEVQAGGHV